MGGIRGDFGKLATLTRRLGRLGPAQAELRQDLAQEALTLVQQGFDRSVDPWDRPWLPLKHRKGQPLRDTGRLMNSFTPVVTATGIRVGTNVSYAPPHQFGAQIAPHTRAKGRYQAIDRSGKFRKHSGIRAKAARVRFLSPATFANGITIPARVMLPIGVPGDRWMRGLRSVVDRWLKRQVMP